jgi:hypothetical protein
MKSSINHSTPNRSVNIHLALPCMMVCLLCLLAGGASGSDETIIPDSWIYPALRTFELVGYVELDPSMPYTRNEVERYVECIISRIAGRGGNLTPRQDFLLERLKTEFLGTSRRPRDREDRPLLFYEHGSDFASFDIAAGGLFAKSVDVNKGEVWSLLRPDLLVDVGGRLTIQTGYRIKIGPERGANIGGGRPAPRERSWRGVTSEYEKGLIFLSGRRWGIRLGRDYLHWGSGREEGLLLSKSAGSLDHLAASLEMGRFELAAIHAVLDLRLQRRFAGHRLSVRLPRGISIGFGETVVYTGRGLDFTYLLPFGSYYANQYNESTDDNVLWGLDWKVPVAKGFIVYGELLIDDFQYESDPPAPDRLGFNMTMEALVTVRGLEVELLAGYTYIDIFTYAHRDTLLTRYVTGNGDPSRNRLIGSPLGPDADRWNARIAAPLHPRLLVSVEGSYTRSGEGSDLREWDWEEDPRPRFPSGEVLEETLIALHQSIDLERGSYISAGGGWRFLKGGPDLLDEDDGFFYLELLLDF